MTTATDRLTGLADDAGCKAPVRAATTANITLEGEQTIDGVACVSGDRVLVKNQTDTTENGIYVVDTGDWSRAKDFDSARDVVDGTLVYVRAGSMNIRALYAVSGTDPIIPGTSAITFVTSGLGSAANISFAPVGTISSLTVQATVAEVSGDVTALAATVPTTTAYTNTLLDDADAAAARATLVVGQASRPVGLSIIPNSGAPNDKVDVSLKAIVLRDSNGGTIGFDSPSGFTIDVTQAGSVANGRDQAGAFSSGSWVHWWAIAKSDGTLRGLASASATSPTLPTGYTFKCYLGATRYDGSSHLVKTSIVGSWAFIQTPADALGTTTVSTSEQTLSLSAVVPPNAMAVQINTVIEAQASGGGNIDSHLFLRFITGQNFHRVKMNSGTNSLFLSASDSLRMPIVGQQVFWLYENSTQVSSSAAGMWVQGYQLPNGGE